METPAKTPGPASRFARSRDRDKVFTAILINAQGEDVVAFVAAGPVKDLKKRSQAVRRSEKVRATLERHFKTAIRVHDRRELFMLQPQRQTDGCRRRTLRCGKWRMRDYRTGTAVMHARDQLEQVLAPLFDATRSQFQADRHRTPAGPERRPQIYSMPSAPPPQLKKAEKVLLVRNDTDRGSSRMIAAGALTDKAASARTRRGRRQMGKVCSRRAALRLDYKTKEPPSTIHAQGRRVL